MRRFLRKAKGKKKAQIIHSKRRFDERFGIKMNGNKMKQIINMIQKGRAKHVMKQSNRVSHWDVEFEGELIRVVYDKKTKVIVTALPN